MHLASMRPPLFSGGNLRDKFVAAAGGIASMRPPLFSGGNPTTASVPSCSRPRFNEASALQRRKLTVTATERRPLMALQ